MTTMNLSEKERIDAFSKALAAVLRRIAGQDSGNGRKSLPENLPKPVTKKEVERAKKK